MKTKRWRPWDDECPRCGDAAEVLTSACKDYYAHDGDEARCVTCHHPGYVVVTEDDAYVHWKETSDEGQM